MQKRRLTSSQSKLGVVPQLQQLLLSLELHQRSHRSEGLLLVHEQSSRRRHVPNDRRRVEVRPELGESLATEEDLASVRDGVLDVLVDLGERAAVDERAVGGRGGERGAELEGRD